MADIPLLDGSVGCCGRFMGLVSFLLRSVRCKAVAHLVDGLDILLQSSLFPKPLHVQVHCSAVSQIIAFPHMLVDALPVQCHVWIADKE